MRKSRAKNLPECLLEFGIRWSARERVRRQFAQLLFVVAAALVIAVGQTAAPTEGSKAAEVRDRLRKAEAYLQEKDPDSAVKEFNAVLAIDPHNGEVHANLGVIAFFRRDYQSAAQNFRKALAVDPSLVKTQALLAICQRRLGDPSARAMLEKSFAKLKDKQLRLQVGMELAFVYDRQGDPTATASVMTSLVELDPDNVDILFMAQRVYSELADNTLNKLAVLAPGSARMQQVIAERLVNQADLKGAIDHYRKALALDPRLPGVHFELGEALRELGPGDSEAEAEAQKEFEIAVTVDGDTAKTECEFARAALSLSQPDQASAHYKRAHELDPHEVQADIGLAKLLMQEKPQEAVKYLRMAVESDPLNGSAHYQLAQAYKRLQMDEMAQKERHLFDEIKATKDRVADLYHQMNRQPKADMDAVPSNEK